jgi:hypothetical protein
MDTNALPNSTAPSINIATKYGLLLPIVLGFTYTFVLAKGVSSYNNALIMRLVIMVVSLSQ